MFDETIRTLQQLEGRQEISVSIPSDQDGYFDRECPSSDCLFRFKIHEDDWRDKVRDEEVFCPFCGHTADSDKWWTQEQVKHAENAALAHISQRLGGALKSDADRWNRRQPRNSFITMTMQVDSLPQLVPLPLAAAQPMKLKISCPACACRYAVIGAAFFCPACGHNAADLMFDQTLTGIRNTIDTLEDLRSAIPDRDTAETTIRLLIENGLQIAVTAFQRYAEALYAQVPNAQQARRNAFQNLAVGSDLWHGGTGKHYSDHLAPGELVELKRAFQQRHLLAHTQGIVDQDYVTRTGDTAYRPGQRLVVSKTSVFRCVDLIEKLTSGMTTDIQGTP